jgi:hypothetical protein
MHRCELIDVATGKRYVRQGRSRATPRRPNVHPATSWRQRRLIRSHHQGVRTIAVTAKPDWIGPLIAFFGALGLFSVLYTYADHIDALLLAMVCLATIFVGTCTTSLREPPPRRP